jgi:serine/threonine protein kinase
VWLGENLPFRDGNESSASLFEENFVLHICRDAASGLDFLHSRGLRHLGLNLECILLFSDRIVIVDHAIHDVTSGGHHIDAIICSPDFSSPEILLEPLFVWESNSRYTILRCLVPWRHITLLAPRRKPPMAEKFKGQRKLFQ